jgi:hypothetical protein
MTDALFRRRQFLTGDGFDGDALTPSKSVASLSVSVIFRCVTVIDATRGFGALMATSSVGSALAFLSACQTAKGDARLPEESVHLAASVLAVGYRGVIGTLWSIGDADVPLVADEFYRHLKEDQTDADGRVHAAYALHGATEVLRKEVGESEFLHWAAFVHFGL